MRSYGYARLIVWAFDAGWEWCGECWLGTRKSPAWVCHAGLGGCLGYSYLGFFRCQKTSDTALRSSTVALCHAIDLKRAIGSPFSIMMAITATLVVFHLAARASACVRLMAVFTSTAVLLISNLLPPICRKTQVKLVMAPLSFLGCAGVRMCPPCNPYSPRRSDNSLPGEIIFQSSGNRSGASGCVFGPVGDDRRF